MATYKAVMRPALEYASSVWSPIASSTSINKLQVMQNAALRELLSTLTSKKRRITAPKGWDLFMRSLKDTDAPADIHLGWKWNKSVEKGDWGSLKDE